MILLTKKEKILKKELIYFEKDIIKIYEKGGIKGPIHLSGNNEESLIKIFRNIKKNDWVISTWRSHYHALLHGFSKTLLKKRIIQGRSMGINSKKFKFYASSIVGGGLSIGIGIAMANKMKNINSNVWIFVGDMTYETGVFHECYKYAKNFKLPVKFVVEDNNLSTNTPTDKTWNIKSQIKKDIIYYKYKRKYPHHGTGNWVLF